ncbi:phosphonate metabolism transcriptional regulator PhnF [Limoniibacter endophyticus]|uniref:Phosphonate metabolism transcriptional regulator PhnF n=1 Tax=Limoniibacter endophyticus TaxID=1565040 RepID=A0A8J3DH09_9HYPH|nr:phosphonate metabolism transcriptional regulator PhnF [Limoniibacter endophyticus]GHC66839.1 phosphonate metabolism transcriptional regulator PhnF [Limoniibacter endophyticus]
MTADEKPAVASTRLRKQGGVALWRQIADGIRQGIREGVLGNGERLPPETDLAERFGVNRHTVRSAIAALVQEGVLRAEQGRGTFIQNKERIVYPISKRTRFSRGIDGQARSTSGRMVDCLTEVASEIVATMLALDPKSPVVKLKSVSLADGLPLSSATSWFDSRRFEGIGKIYEKTGSITASLAHFGVEDYTRRSTTISARHADEIECRLLSLAPGAIVLVTKAINIDASGKPIQFSITRFVADRVELSVSPEEKLEAL